MKRDYTVHCGPVRGGKTRARSAAECGRKCSRKRGCKAWLFWNRTNKYAKKGHCSLRGCTRFGRENKQGFVSGPRGCPFPRRYKDSGSRRRHRPPTVVVRPPREIFTPKLRCLAYKVECAKPTFFADNKMKGNFFDSTKDVPDVAAHGMKRKDISSLVIPAGWCTRLYEGLRFKGKSWQVCAREVEYLSRFAWNNKVQSIRIIDQEKIKKAYMEKKKKLEAKEKNHKAYEREKERLTKTRETKAKVKETKYKESVTKEKKVKEGRNKELENKKKALELKVKNSKNEKHKKEMERKQKAIEKRQKIEKAKEIKKKAHEKEFKEKAAEKKKKVAEEETKAKKEIELGHKKAEKTKKELDHKILEKKTKESEQKAKSKEMDKKLEEKGAKVKEKERNTKEAVSKAEAKEAAKKEERQKKKEKKDKKAKKDKERKQKDDEKNSKAEIKAKKKANLAVEMKKKEVKAKKEREARVKAEEKAHKIDIKAKERAGKVSREVAQKNKYSDLVGKVVDAKDGLALSDAKITLKYNGTSTIHATTDYSGEYSVKVLRGVSYQVHVSHVHYITAHAQTTANKKTYRYQSALSKKMKKGEMRVVLTWGSKPVDLDLHVIAPPTEGKVNTLKENYGSYGDLKPSVAEGVLRHVYWKETSRGFLNLPPYARLENDDEDGMGPETIKIKEKNGVYLGYVQSYSCTHFTSGIQRTRAELEDSCMKQFAASQATVTIFAGSSVLYTKKLNVKTANKVGPFWEVFKMECKSGHCKVHNSDKYFPAYPSKHLAVADAAPLSNHTNFTVIPDAEPRGDDRPNDFHPSEALEPGRDLVPAGLGLGTGGGPLGRLPGSGRHHKPAHKPAGHHRHHKPPHKPAGHREQFEELPPRHPHDLPPRHPHDLPPRHPHDLPPRHPHDLPPRHDRKHAKGKFRDQSLIQRLPEDDYFEDTDFQVKYHD
jgi:uncharacterized protein YfaP (DUF2135 family)